VLAKRPLQNLWKDGRENKGAYVSDFFIKTATSKAQVINSFLVSWLRLSFLSNIPRRFSIIEKCFFVAVVTVLITAPSNKDGDEELRLLDIK